MLYMGCFVGRDGSRRKGGRRMPNWWFDNVGCGQRGLDAGRLEMGCVIRALFRDRRQIGKRDAAFRQ